MTEPAFPLCNSQGRDGSRPLYSAVVNPDNPLELLGNTWTETEGSGMSLVGGHIVCDPDIETGQLSQSLPDGYGGENLPFVYRINIVEITQGTISVPAFSFTADEVGIYTIYATEIPGEFTIQSSDFCDAVINGISVLILNDSHLGAELVANGAFASGASWTFDGADAAALSIAGGKLVVGVPATSDCYAINSGLIEDGFLYKVTLTVSGTVPGDGTLNFILSRTAPDVYEDNPAGDDVAGDGTYTYVASTSVGDAGEITLQMGSTLECSIDDVSVKKYTYDA